MARHLLPIVFLPSLVSQRYIADVRNATLGVRWPRLTASGWGGAGGLCGRGPVSYAIDLMGILSATPPTPVGAVGGGADRLRVCRLRHRHHFARPQAPTRASIEGTAQGRGSATELSEGEGQGERPNGARPERSAETVSRDAGERPKAPGHRAPRQRHRARRCPPGRESASPSPSPSAALLAVISRGASLGCDSDDDGPLCTAECRQRSIVMPRYPLLAVIPRGGLARMRLG
jgi:hypothetical protein